MKKKPRPRAFFSLILLSMLLISCSAIPAHAALSWNVQTVDDRAYATQRRCPIALDSKGLPHIAYTDVRVESDRHQTPLVMYANWNGTVWNTQQIAIGYALSLVLDAADHPHILYKRSLEPLMYASWTGSEWDIQTVDPNSTGGFSGFVALDSYGNPHVAYTDGITVRYAVSNGSEWSVQTVAQYEDVEIPPKLSFVLDKDDTPYIMYRSASYVYFSQDVGIQAINVTLATYHDSRWKFQPLSLPTPIGDYGSLVVNSEGGLHSIFIQHYVSADNRVSSTLLYGSWNGTGWDTQVVSNIGLYDSMSLALDSRDSPHIIADGVYAGWTGTAWDVQATDVSGYLAVDAGGNLHVSWNVARNGSWVSANLMYATVNATELAEATPTPEVTPTFPDSPLLIVTSAVIIGTVIAVIAYMWKKNTTH